MKTDSNPAYLLEVAYNIPCLLGECPVWDDQHERLIWVDTLQGDIHWLFLKNQTYHYCHIDKLIGSIALTYDDCLLAAADQEILQFTDLENGKYKRLAKLDMNTDQRFNDGKCDPAGRFWVGTTSLTNETGVSALYRFDPDFMFHVQAERVSVSNGLAWSIDKKTLYYIDTASSQVVAYEFDMAAGTIGNKQIVINIPKAMGYPDGMTIDEQGMLWIALWDGWSVARWDPDTGQLLRQIFLPVAKPTSCTFGGPDRRDLYITTARYQLTPSQINEQPLAGCLFVIKNLPEVGFPTMKYTTQNA